MADVGRNSLYEPERVERILQALRDGNTHKTAAAIGGIATSTFYDWIKERVEFSEAVKKAEADSEAWHVQNIRRQAQSTWQASAWMLERRNPSEFGRKDKLDVTSDDEKIEGFNITILDPRRNDGD